VEFFTKIVLVLNKSNEVSVGMQISALHILPTKDTPGIILNPEGFIRIDGRGLFGYNSETTEQILNWIQEFLKNPPELTTVIVALEYLNSSSAKILVSILKGISQVVQQHKQYFVHWCYEDDDEDILERGEYISTTFDIPIDFIRTRDIKQCCKSIC
jgi:hypothetical protein